MSGFEDLAKKAFYMGVGFASYAQEKANNNFQELRTQAQSLADEMVERGKLSTDEARKFVDELVEQAQKEVGSATDSNSESREPRRIEIVDEDEPDGVKSTETTPGETKQNSESQSDDLRRQVESLKEELRRLKSEM